MALPEMNTTPVSRGLRNLVSLLGSGSPSLIWKTFLNYSFSFLRAGRMPLPVELQIEPASVCNLKCEMCNIDRSQKKRFLLPSDLNKILKEIKPLKSINFTGVGESLLNPDIMELLGIARRNGIATSMITNGQLLTNALADRLLEERLVSIGISMESGIPETYEQIRRGADYNRLKENLTYLAARNRSMEYPARIAINVVLMELNLGNLEHIYRIMDLADLAGIKHVNFQNLHCIGYSFTPDDLASKYESISSYARGKNISICLPRIVISKGSCYYPWMYPQVTASGELLPCCIISQFGPKYVHFGNVLETRFIDAWNSGAARTFRGSLKDNTATPCKYCTKYMGIL